MSRRRRELLCAALAMAGVLLGCQVDLERMLDQHKAKPYRPSPFFEDGLGMRAPPRGTVPFERATGSPWFLAGHSGDVYADRVPVAIDAALLARGEDRFRIFCSACHGPLGDGVSPVAENMLLRRPPSLHEPRIQALLPGRIFRVIGEGYGLMPGYADPLSPRDRWAVVAFLRALWLSQDVALADLPPSLREEARPWL